MDAKELSGLSRKELLELLLSVIKENEKLKKKIAAYEEAVNNRTIAIEECGSIAEASLKLSGIFEAAQEAADLYLDNIRRIEAELRQLSSKGSSNEP